MPVAKRMLVKDMKIEIVLTEELRCKLADILNGHTDIAEIGECHIRYMRARRVESETAFAENVRMRRVWVQGVSLRVLPPIVAEMTPPDFGQ